MNLIKNNFDILTILKSQEFVNRLKSAIECGVEEDWYWDSSGENRFDTFNPDDATKNVIEFLKEYLLIEQ